MLLLGHFVIISFYLLINLDNFLCGHSHIELYENLKNGATVGSPFTFNYYIASKQIFSFGVVIKIYLSYLYISWSDASHIFQAEGQWTRGG